MEFEEWVDPNVVETEHIETKIEYVIHEEIHSMPVFENISNEVPPETWMGYEIVKYLILLLHFDQYTKKWDFYWFDTYYECDDTTKMFLWGASAAMWFLLFLILRFWNSRPSNKIATAFFDTYMSRLHMD